MASFRSSKPGERVIDVGIVFLNPDGTSPDPSHVVAEEACSWADEPVVSFR
jgi:hypothetical protein